MTVQNSSTATAQPVSELTALVVTAVEALGFKRQEAFDGTDTFWKPNTDGDTWVSINNETGVCEVKALNKSGVVTRSERVTVSNLKLAEKVARLSHRLSTYAG